MLTCKLFSRIFMLPAQSMTAFLPINLPGFSEWGIKLDNLNSVAICMISLAKNGIDYIKSTNMKLPKPVFVNFLLYCIIIWCSYYTWVSFNPGLRTDRKLKTQNTLRLQEILKRRFTGCTSLTSAWEMMEHTLSLPPTVRDRVARQQNSMYIVSICMLSVDICVLLSYHWNYRINHFNPSSANNKFF